MLYSLPSNIISFFVLGVSITLFGVRGLYLYTKQKTPLIFYYGLGATFGGISALAYSVPFIFTQTESVLKLTTLVGDVLYYASIIVMTRIIWYLGFNKRIAYGWVAAPYLVMIVGAMTASLVYMPTVHYVFSAGHVEYPVPLVASWFFAAMSTAYIFVGFLTLRQSRLIKVPKQRLRLLLIGLAFLVGGIFAVMNFLFSQGSNNSLFGVVGYALVAALLFIGIFVISRSKSIRSNKIST